MVFYEYCEIKKNAYFEENLFLKNVKPSFSSIYWSLQNRCSYKCFFTIAEKHMCRNLYNRRKTHVSEWMSYLIDIIAALSLFKKRFRRWCFLYSYLKFSTTTFLTLDELWKKSIVVRSVDQISITNLITQHFIFNLAKISVFQAETTAYKKSYQSKKITKNSK